MTFLELLQSVVLGLVEGLTEFLPISSTGHLIIAGDLLGYTGEQAKTFEICIQLAAILAVCWHYRTRLMQVIKSLHNEQNSQRFALNLIIAVLPAAFLGLLLHGLIKAYLFNSITVALALIAGGVFILWVESRERTARIIDLEQITWLDALKLGCVQAVSLLPGTSRSGATIIGGMLLGLSRQAATEFSFFLAIPTMFLATGYDVLKSWHVLAEQNALFFLTGFVVAFVSALAAIQGLLRYVAHHDFRLFAYYRIIFGLIIVAYFLLKN